MLNPFLLETPVDCAHTCVPGNNAESIGAASNLPPSCPAPTAHPHPTAPPQTGRLGGGEEGLYRQVRGRTAGRAEGRTMHQLEVIDEHDLRTAAGAPFGGGSAPFGICLVRSG